MLLRLNLLQRHLRPPTALNTRSIHHSTLNKMRIIPISTSPTNYMYIIAEGGQGAISSTESTPKAMLVDPAHPKALEKVAVIEGLGQGLDILGVLTTHHHKDHDGGNSIIAKAKPGIAIYGGSQRVQAVTEILKDGDELSIGDSIKIKCLATPCHTQDSICFYVTDGLSKAVFTGDTLFQGGCGRFFEGTPEEMIASLSYLAKLPEDTTVYNGHEYTADNLKFAKTVEPDNAALARLQNLVDSHKVTAGKSNIGDEKEWNVFMRLDSKAILEATGKSEPADVMKVLREKKNEM